MNLEIYEVLNLEKSKYSRVGAKGYIEAYFTPTVDLCTLCCSSQLAKDGYTKRVVMDCSHNYIPIIITCHIQRYVCKKCKHIFYEDNPIANPYEKVTKLSNIIVLNKLLSASATFKSVAIDTHISIQNVIDIFDKYVEYSPIPLPTILCFDEKHINKALTENGYAFIISDFCTSNLYDMLESRKKHVLEKYFYQIPLETRQKVMYITTDMWDTYIDVGKRFFKNAKIAVDSFHVVKAINKAMDTIRLIVMRKFNEKTDDLEDNHIYYYLLKKYSNYFTMEFDDIFGKRFYQNKLKRTTDKHEILKMMLDIDPRLEEAYTLTKRYREFNRCCTIENCSDELNELINSFYDSSIASFNSLALTLDKYREYIINSFIRISNIQNKNGKLVEKRLSNSTAEGINNIIEKLNANAGGYTNFNRFRLRCLYVINKNLVIRNSAKKLKKNIKNKSKK